MYPPPPNEDPKEVILQVLRWHASEDLGCRPNMETVQFMRSRSIPGHQLHDVAFQDSKGQPGDWRFLLCQWSNGTWKVVEHAGGLRNVTYPHSEPLLSSDLPWLSLGGSTAFLQETGFPGGVEAAQEVGKILNSLIALGDREKIATFWRTLEEKLHRVPEEDKIQEIREFLHDFQQTLPERHGTEEEQLGPFNHFFAHGNVIDNGFDIVRVRLISANGLVFEDVIQDGLVFFASHRKVVRPLQAELYNRSGELISRQTVLQPCSFPPDAQLGGMFHSKP
jgi:hypothetical protein